MKSVICRVVLVCFMSISWILASDALNAQQSSKKSSKCQPMMSIDTKHVLKESKKLAEENVERMEKLLQDFMKCLTTRTNPDLCFRDHKIPVSDSAKNIHEKYVVKLSDLRKRLSDTMTNKSLENVLQLNILRTKVDQLNLQLKCKTESHERQREELMERFKKVESRVQSDSRSHLNLASKPEKPCVNLINQDTYQSKISILENTIDQKDNLIGVLQNNLESTTEILLKQRNVILLSSELIRVQKVMLESYTKEDQNFAAKENKDQYFFVANQNPQKVDDEIKLEPNVNIPIERTHWYHLESTFCDENGHKFIYRSSPNEGTRDPEMRRIKNLWMADVNHRYLEVPLMSNDNESNTVWAKVHSDDNESYDLELKPRTNQ